VLLKAYSETLTVGLIQKSEMIPKFLRPLASRDIFVEDGIKNKPILIKFHNTYPLEFNISRIRCEVILPTTLRLLKSIMTRITSP